MPLTPDCFKYFTKELVVLPCRGESAKTKPNNHQVARRYDGDKLRLVADSVKGVFRKTIRIASTRIFLRQLQPEVRTKLMVRRMRGRPRCVVDPSIRENAPHFP